MAVDYDSYMRRQALYAVAEAAQKRNMTVVAVNRPLCPFTTLMTKRQRVGEIFKKATLDQLAPNLYRYSPTYFLHDHLAYKIPGAVGLNYAALRSSYNSLQKRLGITEPSPIVWYNYPEQGYVSDLFDGSFNIYELYDQLSDANGNPLIRSQGLRKKLIPKTDLLLTTSRKLQESYGPDYRRSYLLGNGLPRSTFEALSDPEVKPDESLSAIPSPRIGLAGVISKRVDTDLLAGLAEAKPEWNLVLVGPHADQTAIEKLSRFKNVHLPGPVEQSRIPSVLKALDVGLLPYQSNDFFDYLNPLKFYEMAAAGLPIVSWPNHEMEQFPSELVRTVPKEVGAWAKVIEMMLSRPRAEITALGRSVASEYLWEDMAEKLMGYLEGSYRSQ